MTATDPTAAGEARAVPTAGRPVRAAARPTGSVVIGWLGDATALDDCLSEILPTAERIGLEVVVALAGPGTGHHPPRPGVRVVSGRADASRRELRAMGVAAAEGDIVIVSDDLSPPDATRLTSVGDAFSEL